MLMGKLRSKIDGIWNDFWSGGLANPLQVIEQITYLTFIKHLDESQELEADHRAHLGKLDALFASLQHRAFRGEL